MLLASGDHRNAETFALRHQVRVLPRDLPHPRSTTRTEPCAVFLPTLDRRRLGEVFLIAKAGTMLRWQRSAHRPPPDPTDARHEGAEPALRLPDEIAERHATATNLAEGEISPPVTPPARRDYSQSPRRVQQRFANTQHHANPAHVSNTNVQNKGAKRVQQSATLKRPRAIFAHVCELADQHERSTRHRAAAGSDHQPRQVNRGRQSRTSRNDLRLTEAHRLRHRPLIPRSWRTPHQRAASPSTQRRQRRPPDSLEKPQVKQRGRILGTHRRRFRPSGSCHGRRPGRGAARASRRR